MPEEISKNSTQMANAQNQTNISPPVQVPSNDLQPQNSRKPNLKILITLGIVAVIIIVFILGSFAFLSQQKQITPDSLETKINPATTEVPSPTLSPEETLKAPELYPKFEWKEFIESELDKSLGKSALYSQKGKWGSIRMNGKEWTASKDNLDRDSMEVLLTGFDEYYNSELTQRGWSYIYEDKQYNLVPLSADGPGGSIRGYIKVNDGKLRVILLEKFTPIKGFGGVASCPCSIKLRVFVSDIEPIEELVKRIN